MLATLPLTSSRFFTTVSHNKSNLRVLNQMLENLKTMLMEYYCFGQQLGSSPLWEQHHQAIRWGGQDMLPGQGVETVGSSVWRSAHSAARGGRFLNCDSFEEQIAMYCKLHESVECCVYAFVFHFNYQA